MIGFFFFLFIQINGALSDALPNAHAHNDYYHERPLHGALDAGFSSIEVDVILRNDTLFVGHDAHEIRSARTLRSLYLDPLHHRINEQGRLFKQDVPLTLLIDFKSEASASYEALKQTLTDYSDFISSYENNKVKEKLVRIVISGNRPITQIVAEKKRLATFDGRFNDLPKNYPHHVMWLVSANASKILEWTGSGPIEPSDIAKLDSLVTVVHKAGKKLRFWATWDKPGEARGRQWVLFRQKGLDYINTDDIEGLKFFLTSD